MKFDWVQGIRKYAAALLSGSAWRSERDVPRLQKFLHFWVLVWNSFSRNRCPARASALAYATLLALIPMLAVVISVTSSFLKTEGETSIDHFIVKFVANVMPRPVLNTNVQLDLTNAAGPGLLQDSPAATTNPAQPAVDSTARSHTMLPSTDQEIQAARARREIAHRIHEFIQNTRSSALGVTGTIALIVAAIAMLSQIETTFNDIWGAAEGRSLFMRVVLYWTVTSLGPILLALAVGLTTGPHWQSTQRLLTLMPLLGNLIFEFVPVLLLCLALALFYRTMPNTKVHWNAALVGGLVGGVFWHLNSLVSVLYVSRVVTNSRIYGSLGLVPVFMIGVYFAWWILLFGAQVAYAFQNRASFVEQAQVDSIDQRGRELLALRLLAWIGRRFLHGEPPVTVFEMAKELEVPTRLIQQIMQSLCTACLVIPAVRIETAYVPARPLGTISCHDIMVAMRASRGKPVATRQEPTASKIYAEFRRIERAEQEVASSVSLEALAEVSRLGVRPPAKSGFQPQRLPEKPGTERSLAE